MYNMKSRVVFFVLSALLMIMAGCDNNQSGQSDSNVSNIEMLSDTIKQQLVKQDSLSKELLHQVDTLTTELNSAKAEIEHLKTSVEQKESRGFLWTILPMAIGSLGLIIAIIVGFCTRHDVEKDDVKNILNEHLRNIGLLKLKEQFKSLMTSCSQQKASNQVSTDRIVALEQRIKILEGKITDVTPVTSAPAPMKTVERHINEISIPKHLYANSNSKEYFTNVLESKQDTCVYIIDLETATKGQFDIISIEKIKQRNGWESVIEYTGDCTISEAKSFKTNKLGKCEKVSDGTWKVVEKLKITISK